MYQCRTHIDKCIFYVVFFFGYWKACSSETPCKKKIMLMAMIAQRQGSLSRHNAKMNEVTLPSLR